MKPTIAIRRVSTAADRRECGRIRTAAYVDEFGWFDDPDRERDPFDRDALHFLGLLSRRPAGTVRLVVNDLAGGMPCMAAATRRGEVLSLPKGQWAELSRIAVLHEARGSGLARRLVARAAFTARALGTTDILVDVFIEGPVNLSEWVRSLGFVPFGWPYAYRGRKGSVASQVHRASLEEIFTNL